MPVGFYNLTGLLGDTISYTVNFDGTTPVPYGDPSAALSPSTSFTCTALTDQTVTVNIDDTALQDKAADTYSDTLILTVAPL